MAALLLVALPLAALDFSVSPNPDGSFDMRASHEWKYGEGPWFSSATLESSSSSSSEKDETSRTMSVERDVRAKLVPLGLKLESGPAELGASLDLGWERMNISELGYVDATVGSVAYRFFLANDRLINLALPKLRVDSSLDAGPVSIDLGGEYSPWLYVRLDQTLSTSATPSYPAELPTDREHESSQSAYNAFSIDGSLRFRSDFIEPGIEAVYDWLAIKYEYVGALGSIDISNSRMSTLTLGGSAVLRFVKIAGLSPKIRVSRVMEWADDLSDDAGAVAGDSRWKFFLGFAK